MRTLTAAITVLLLVITATASLAHGTPDTAEYEEWLWGDFGTDLTLIVPTGYEIDNVIYREAHLPEHGGPGIVMRIDAYGGADFFSSEAFFLYEFTGPTGTVTMVQSTTDDETLTGDGVVLDLDVTPSGLAAQSAIVEITTFFTLEELGLQKGDELSDLSLATAWDAGAGMWYFDRVPGGTALVPAPAPADAPIIPEGGDTSPFEPRIVQGGEQHLQVDISWSEVGVTNPLEETVQQVTVFGDGQALESIRLNPGDSIFFPIDEADIYEFISDIGGYGSATGG